MVDCALCRISGHLALKASRITCLEIASTLGKLAGWTRMVKCVKATYLNDWISFFGTTLIRPGLASREHMANP